MNDPIEDLIKEIRKIGIKNKVNSTQIEQMISIVKQTIGAENGLLDIDKLESKLKNLGDS
jgi:hypothetical protein